MAGRAEEALADAVQIRRGHAAAVVADIDVIGVQIKLHLAVRRAVAHGVVEQVAQQQTQQHFVAATGQYIGPAVGAEVALQADVLLACGQVDALQRLLADALPRHRSGVWRCFERIKPRQGEQLVDQMAGTVDAVADGGQALLLFVRLVGERQYFGLHFQCRQGAA